ncbi:MAG: hypothetical protein ACJA0T_000100 [Colwellia sp.]|jgi:hypothetical protein
MKCPARSKHLDLDSDLGLDLTTRHKVRGKVKHPFGQSALLVLLVWVFRVQSEYLELEE